MTSSDECEVSINTILHSTSLHKINMNTSGWIIKLHLGDLHNSYNVLGHFHFKWYFVVSKFNYHPLFTPPSPLHKKKTTRLV